MFTTTITHYIHAHGNELFYDDGLSVAINRIGADVDGDAGGDGGVGEEGVQEDNDGSDRSENIGRLNRQP